MNPDRMKATGRVNRPSTISTPPISSIVPVKYMRPVGILSMNGRPAGKPKSLPVPCSRNASPAAMRSSERACGASHAVLSAETPERGRTLLMAVAFFELVEWLLTPDLSEELGGGLGDQLALVPRAVEFDLGRLALALPARDCGCAIRRTADDLVKRALPRVAIGQADDDQAEMEEVRDDRQERHLVAAMLRRSRGERAAHLSNQRAAQPQLAALLPETAHGRGHAAETCRRAHDDRVIVRQFFDLGDRRWLIELEVRGLGDLFGNI